MTPKEINQLITQIETHIECWKQFNHFIGLARAKKFTVADDNHFLEIKSNWSSFSPPWRFIPPPARKSMR